MASASTGSFSVRTVTPSGDGDGSSGSVIGEAQPIGVAGVDEELGRGFGDHHVRLAGVDADVAAPGPFPPQRLDQLWRIGERLAENEPAPTQFELDILGHRLHQLRRRGVVQAHRDRLGVVARRDR